MQMVLSSPALDSWDGHDEACLGIFRDAFWRFSLHCRTGCLLVLWTEEGGSMVPRIRAAAGHYLPGASAKQPNIIHSTLVRVLTGDIARIVHLTLTNHDSPGGAVAHGSVATCEKPSRSQTHKSRQTGA